MFEPVDAGARVYQIGGAQLFDVSQPLELWRVDEGHAQRMEHDVPVYVVVEHFAGIGHDAIPRDDWMMELGTAEKKKRHITERSGSQKKHVCTQT